MCIVRYSQMREDDHLIIPEDMKEWYDVVQSYCHTDFLEARHKEVWEMWSQSVKLIPYNVEDKKERLNEHKIGKTRFFLGVDTLCKGPCPNM